MASKSLLTVTLALLAIQASAFGHIEPRDLLQQAQKAVTDLSNIVSDRVKNSILDIQNKLTSLQTFSKDTLSTATVLLQTSVSSSLDEINTVADSAILHGKDPSECLGDKEDAIKNVPVNTINEIVSCVNANLTAASTNVGQTSAQISGQMKAVYDLQKKLTTCNVGVTGTQCFVDVLSQAAKLTATVPGKVVSLELGSTKQLDTLKENVATCSIVRVFAAQHNVTLETQTIKDCINQL